MSDLKKNWLCYECFKVEVSLSEIDLWYRGKVNVCEECTENPPNDGGVISKKF